METQRGMNCRFVKSNEREYMIWRVAQTFQVRRRDDPLNRGGSLVGATRNPDDAITLIQRDSGGGKIELGPWRELGTMDEIEKPDPFRAPKRRKRSVVRHS